MSSMRCGCRASEAIECGSKKYRIPLEAMTSVDECACVCHYAEIDETLSKRDRKTSKVPVQGNGPTQLRRGSLRSSKRVDSKK
jgi:hypothetical protein